MFLNSIEKILNQVPTKQSLSGYQHPGCPCGGQFRETLREHGKIGLHKKHGLKIAMSWR